MVIASLSISVITALIGFFVKSKGIIAISYGFVIPLTLLLPRFFYYFDSKVKKVVKIEWVKKLDFFAFFLIIVNAPGSLILHNLDFQYDRFLHFVAAFFALIILFLLWLPAMKVKGKEVQKKHFLIFVFVILFIALFFWEGLQYSIDYKFGTKLFFDKNQDIKTDFIEDIFFGLSGLIVSLFYLNRYFDRITIPIWK